ncbi:MAG: SRPBCC domain-containing protein [Cytophagaceae bacterium]
MKNQFTGRVSAEINAETHKVWDALTNPELIRQYFFGTNAVSDWKVGSPLYFRGTWEGKSYEDKGTILQSEPGKIFKYNYWSSMSGIEDKPENYVDVSYVLESKGKKTQLTIIQENIPSDEMRKHSETNWGMVIDGLKKVVEK